MKRFIACLFALYAVFCLAGEIVVHEGESIHDALRQAREEARIIKNDARVEASEMRLKAQHDAYQLLSSVEDELTEACKNIRRRRAELGDENE